ncbi:hypothetical protein [Butyrivibrio sp. INlla21]|uniref:hypothetical protein n=1 Tax=Butyrivibrio sp. INlla21 TaxID=1520811 RepID=UPI0008F2A36C|nr:hypothetical protein [Butyrivibrio sp. INlla21]SFU57360.1 hypothetical protein SAMN02910342_00941 [Butyrivibrio sp. INlla21]
MYSNIDMWIKPLDSPDATYQKLGNCEVIALTSVEEPKESIGSKYFASDSITIPCKIKNITNFKAFCIYMVSGNDLYLRFPKKLRRKRGWK